MGRLNDRVEKLEADAGSALTPLLWTNGCGSRGDESWEEYRERQVARLTKARDEGRQIQLLIWRGLGDERARDIWLEVFPDYDGDWGIE